MYNREESKKLTEFLRDIRLSVGAPGKITAVTKQQTLERLYQARENPDLRNGLTLEQVEDLIQTLNPIR